MSRPSHAMQQIKIDDALASMPSARWRWLFTPDPRWLAAVNTVTLREVNGIRMFVASTVLFFALEIGVVSFALLRCGVLISLFGYKILQILPPSGKLTVEQWKSCEESPATTTMLNFADSLFNGYWLILAAMVTVAVGGKFLNRTTDTEHNVEVLKAKAEVERAKAAGKPDQVNTAEAGGTVIAPVTTDRPAVPAHQPGMDNSRVDDERGEG